MGKCRGLLGARMEVTTFEDPRENETINLKCWTREQGTARVVAAEQEPHADILE